MSHGEFSFNGVGRRNGCPAATAERATIKRPGRPLEDGNQTKMPVPGSAGLIPQFTTSLPPYQHGAMAAVADVATAVCYTTAVRVFERSNA
jgi:hypothetical protein